MLVFLAVLDVDIRVPNKRRDFNTELLLVFEHHKSNKLYVDELKPGRSQGNNTPISFVRYISYLPWVTKGPLVVNRLSGPDIPSCLIESC